MEATEIKLRLSVDERRVPGPACRVECIGHDNDAARRAGLDSISLLVCVAMTVVNGSIPGRV